ncbi:Phytocyanin domain [Sesbania bispinosa]|nr:Phytocyanin domain [Sesbania bispinosa]
MKMREMIVAFVVVAISLQLLGGKWVAAAAEVHHVVGGDRGWDPTSNLLAWSSGRALGLGTKSVRLTYSVAQGLVAELKSREEYESCDVRNPIKMYTEGLHTIPLEREGIRYFVSSDPHNCKNGLKLHVEVMPKASPITLPLQAAGPTAPSASARYAHNSILTLMLIFGVTLGFSY